MIKDLSGLKQQQLQVNDYASFYLQRHRGSGRNGHKRKFIMKNICLRWESNQRFLAFQSDAGINDLMRYKSCKTMRWQWMRGRLKNAAIQCIKLIIAMYCMYLSRLSDKICISLKTNVDVIYYCLQNLACKHKTIMKWNCIIMCYSLHDSESVLNAKKHLSWGQSVKGVRLESQESLVQFPAETYIFI